MLPLWVTVDLGAMAIKGTSNSLKFPALLKPHHQIVSALSRILVGWGLTPLQSCSRCILQPQPRWNNNNLKKLRSPMGHFTGKEL